MGFRVQGMGFRVWGLGFRVVSWGGGFTGSGFRLLSRFLRGNIGLNWDNG